MSPLPHRPTPAGDGTKAHAESRLAELRTAARKGEAFNAETGLPVSAIENRADRSWYEHVSVFVERRWAKVGGGQRRSMADAIATATPALLAGERGKPDPALVRNVMYGWVCNMARRGSSAMPDEVAAAMAWLQDNTASVSALADQARLDAVLDLLATRLDGKPAAANTIARRRSVLSSILGYAVDEGRSMPTPWDAAAGTPPTPPTPSIRMSSSTPSRHGPCSPQSPLKARWAGTSWPSSAASTTRPSAQAKLSR